MNVAEARWQISLMLKMIHFNIPPQAIAALSMYKAQRVKTQQLVDFVPELNNAERIALRKCLYSTVAKIQGRERAIGIMTLVLTEVLGLDKRMDHACTVQTRFTLGSITGGDFQGLKYGGKRRSSPQEWFNRLHRNLERRGGVRQGNISHLNQVNVLKSRAPERTYRTKWQSGTQAEGTCQLEWHLAQETWFGRR